MYKKIEDLIFLKTSLYTNKFRELLLYDEETDFCRRFYFSYELKEKLNRILRFYDGYSKIFPNYIIMNGAKFVYKNIKKKTKNDKQDTRDETPIKTKSQTLFGLIT